MKALKQRVQSNTIIASSNISRKGTRAVVKTCSNLKVFGSKTRSKLSNIIK